MGTENTSAGSRPEHRGLPYWMDRTLKELEKVRAAPEADAVHDTRVAMRRCRSVAAVMEEVDPDATWREMRKLARKPFRQLGALRDTQVLEEWTKKLAAEGDAVRRRLLEEFEKQEAEQRDAALKAAGRFDEKAWRRCERALRRRARLVPVDSPTAECLALERLEETKQAHAQALRSDKPEPWHALRISVKRLRYTVESLLPGRYEEWAEGLKRLQDLLGEVHDLDVLRQAVERLASGEAEESRTAFEQRIDGERRERLDTYRQLTLGKASLWQHWRAGLPHGEHLDAAAWARLRATCRATDQDAARTSQISRLTMRLFDALGRADAGAVFERHELRRVMSAAALLHGIGSGLNKKSPQKAARDFLKERPAPPGWTHEDWNALAQVVRYSRGDQPKRKHKSFAELADEEQKAVSALAGVLRLARALRKCGVESATGLRVDKSVDAVIVRAPGLADTEAAAARLAAGKHLLEGVLGRPVILRAIAAMPKVVKMPTKEPAAETSAVASD